LGDCVNFLSGGTPSKKNPEYWDGDIPWVSCKDMKTAYLSDSQDHITEAGAANGTRLVSPGTILIVVRGMILAQHFPVAIAKRKMAFNQDLKALQCTPNVDPKFLFHWLQGKSYEILGIADEAAHGTKRLQTDRLQNFPLHLPPLPLQRKIAAILSAYDDLIENNTRRIEILEEMARSLYREWFVNFRSETEKVENRTLNDICEFIVDCEHKTAPTQATGYPSIRTPNIGRGRLLLDKVNRVSEETYKAWTKRAIPQEGDLILAREAPVGNVAIISKNLKVCLGQRTVLIRPDISKVKPYYLLYLLLTDEVQHKLLSFSNGATVHHLNMKDIRNLELPELHILPIQQKINTILANYYGLIFNLTRKIENLRQTRDLLLPKLISGEIDVENLDINTGEIAA
jgi:type I restriction enzyme S subunit